MYQKPTMHVSPICFEAIGILALLDVVQRSPPFDRIGIDDP
jgi:hypothetical protein